MQSRSPISRRVSLLLASLITIFATPSRTPRKPPTRRRSVRTKRPIAVNVLVGQSRVINFDRPVGRFSVSNPEIAEAVLVTPDQVLVNGKAFGQVNFIAWEQTGGQFLVFDVYVAPTFR
jgi:Flp pilus assembly secretin CpaC